jgi:hypothetical protein
MTCNHEQFKCTNGVFYCLKCGAEIANPYVSKATPAQAETAPEPPKKATKRKRSETK